MTPLQLQKQVLELKQDRPKDQQDALGRLMLIFLRLHESRGMPLPTLVPSSAQCCVEAEWSSSSSWEVSATIYLDRLTADLAAVSPNPTESIYQNDILLTSSWDQEILLLLVRKAA